MLCLALLSNATRRECGSQDPHSEREAAGLGNETAASTLRFRFRRNRVSARRSVLCHVLFCAALHCARIPMHVRCSSMSCSCFAMRSEGKAGQPDQPSERDSKRVKISQSCVAMRCSPLHSRVLHSDALPCTAVLSTALLSEGSAGLRLALQLRTPSESRSHCDPLHCNVLSCFVLLCSAMCSPALSCGVLRCDA